MPIDFSAYQQGQTVTVFGNVRSLTKAKAAFVGWALREDGGGARYAAGATFVMGAANVSLYAVWTPTYTVTYHANGATGGFVPTDPSAYQEGEKVTVLGNVNLLTKAGETFVGWTVGEDGGGTEYNQGAYYTMGAGDVDFYAKWTAMPTHALSYDKNGADAIGTVPEPTQHYQGQTVTVSGNTGSLDRPGYYFDGWNELSSGLGANYAAGTGQFSMPDHAMSLYARWTAETYIVTYDAEGGTPSVASSQATYNSKYPALATADKTGYTFAGWWTGDNGTGSEVTAGVTTVTDTSDHTLYAKWTAKQYTVSFDAEGGTPSIASVTATFDSAYPTLATAARPGWAFGGWWTGDGGTGSPVTVGTTVTTAANHTLYAKWTTMQTLWARTTSTAPAEAWLNSTAVGPDGSVYCAGYITGNGTFDFGNGVSVTGKNTYKSILLVKYSAAGVAQWANTLVSGPLASQFNSIVVDGSGYVYAAGVFRGTGTYVFPSLSAVSVTGVGFDNALLVKYDEYGYAIWARSPSAGADGSEFLSVAMAAPGYVVVAGRIQKTVNYNFGSGIINGSSIYSNALLVEYSTHEGTAIWAKTVTAGTDGSGFYAVAVDASYNIIAAGYIDLATIHNFSPTVSATGSNTTSANKNNAVVVKYNSSGTATWARTVSGATAPSVYKAVAVDTSGNIYAAGQIYNNVEFGFGNDKTLTGVGSTNPALVKYNSSGTAQWARTQTTSTQASFDSLAIDSGNNVYAVGDGANGTNFGDGIVMSGSGGSLVKYDSSGVALRARAQIVNPDSCWYLSVAVGSGGSVYAAGYIRGSGVYDFGDGATASGTNSSYAPALAKYFE